MADKNLIFDFFNLSGKEESIKKAKRYFAQAGAAVATVDVDAKVRRTAGVSYREVHFGFADNQTVSFGIKQTGDVYQAKVNGKLLPLRSQDDHQKAVVEIVAAMTKGRAKFQAALAKTKVELPKSIRTAAPKMEQVLREKIASVDEAISAARDELASLTGEPVPS
jgi:hypothetical protein